jgi:mono/diheme cytochrome c family protein
MKKKHFNASCFGFALFLAAGLGCHSTRRGEPITGPLPIPNEKVGHGQIVFFKNCYQCHPGGEAGLGPALNNKPAPVFLMKTQVRVGLGAMPSFSKEQISPEELDDLMAYVIQLRKGDQTKRPG